VHHVQGYIPSIALWIEASYHYPLIASASIGMFYNQPHLNHSGNKLWARIFQTSLCQSLVLSLLVIHEFCDECHRHLSSLCIISYLVKLIYVQSFHVLVILISSCSRHQPQIFSVWLFSATFDGWFTSLPLRVFRPNLGTRFFLGGKAVTVHVFVMLGKYFVSVKYVFVSVELMCVMWNFRKLKSASKKGIFVITEKPKVVFVKCICIKIILKWVKGGFANMFFLPYVL
jgi:hypothetical protein